MKYIFYALAVLAASLCNALESHAVNLTTDNLLSNAGAENGLDNWDGFGFSATTSFNAFDQLPAEGARYFSTDDSLVGSTSRILNIFGNSNKRGWYGDSDSNNSQLYQLVDISGIQSPISVSATTTGQTDFDIYGPGEGEVSVWTLLTFLDSNLARISRTISLVSRFDAAGTDDFSSNLLDVELPGGTHFIEYRVTVHSHALGPNVYTTSPFVSTPPQPDDTFVYSAVGFDSPSLNVTYAIPEPSSLIIACGFLGGGCLRRK